MAQYYGVVHSENELAHYGVKGMRWGVRKALVTGNQRALDRHFRKAAKKLRKLEDIAVNSKKYAAKATAYGVAAAGTGTFVVKNPQFFRKRGFAKYVEAKKMPIPTLHDNKSDRLIGQISAYDISVAKRTAAKEAKKKAETEARKLIAKGNKYDKLIRIGAGAATAGLATAAGVNAYRATHGKKYRQKAMNFRNEMDQVFAGTKYAGKYTVQKKAKKRRK